VERFTLKTTNDGVGPSGEAGWVSRTAGSYDPGVPYGTYTVCAKTGSGTGSRWWRQTGVNLTDPTRGTSSGSTTVTPSATGNPDSATCPP
jgi:hypothetical protein